jgi:hypothetical protein
MENDNLHKISVYMLIVLSARVSNEKAYLKIAERRKMVLLRVRVQKREGYCRHVTKYA